VLQNNQTKVPVRQRGRVERTHREDSAVVERTQALISKDPGQSLQKLTSIVGISESTMRRIVKEDHMFFSTVH